MKNLYNSEFWVFAVGIFFEKIMTYSKILMLKVRTVVDDQITVLNRVNNLHGFFIFQETVIRFANHPIYFVVSEIRI